LQNDKAEQELSYWDSIKGKITPWLPTLPTFTELKGTIGRCALAASTVAIHGVSFAYGGFSTVTSGTFNLMNNSLAGLMNLPVAKFDAETLKKVTIKYTPFALITFLAGLIDKYGLEQDPFGQRTLFQFIFAILLNQSNGDFKTLMSLKGINAQQVTNRPELLKALNDPQLVNNPSSSPTGSKKNQPININPEETTLHGFLVSPRAIRLGITGCFAAALAVMYKKIGWNLATLTFSGYTTQGLRAQLDLPYVKPDCATLSALAMKIGATLAVSGFGVLADYLSNQSPLALNSYAILCMFIGFKLFEEDYTSLILGGKNIQQIMNLFGSDKAKEGESNPWNTWLGKALRYGSVPVVSAVALASLLHFGPNPLTFAALAFSDKAWNAVCNIAEFKADDCASFCTTVKDVALRIGPMALGVLTSAAIDYFAFNRNPITTVATITHFTLQTTIKVIAGYLNTITSGGKNAAGIANTTK